MKRTIAILCLLCMVFALPVSGTAEDSKIRPCASEVITSTRILVAVKDGTLTASANVRAKNTASKIGFSSVTVYVLNGSTWKLVASTQDIYQSNKIMMSATISCAVESGKTYKVECNSYVEIGSKSDTGYAYKTITVD